MTDHDSGAGRICAGFTDQELVQRIQSCGDRVAMDCLWQKYRTVVEHVIAGVLRFARREEVEDIAGDVWATVLDPKILRTWSGSNESICPWIRAIARNKANDYGRHLREYLWEADRENNPFDNPEKEALARIARARLLEALYRCMAGLTDVEYLAFSAWLDGGKPRELAAVLGKEPNAVSQDLHRAKEKVFGQLCRHYRDLLPEDISGATLCDHWRRG